MYTHGHADHVGGSSFFAAAAERDGHDRPEVIGHRNVQARLDRYELTNNWNLIINARQFGGVAGELNLGIGDGGEATTVAANPAARRFLPAATLAPDHVVGDVVVVHGRRRIASSCTTPAARPTTTCGRGSPNSGG